MEKEGLPGTGFFYNIKCYVFCQFLLMSAQWTHTAYIRSCISTFERRYGFTSSYIGFIISLQELTQVSLGLFLSYFGSRVHRPRCVGVGGLLMASAAACQYLLHCLYEPFFIPAEDGGDLMGTALCLSSRDNISNPVACQEGSRPSSVVSESQAAALTLILSQVLFGLGTVPVQPFGVSYLDDFASPKKAAVYLGILQATIPLGSSFGNILSSITLQIYVDMDKIDMDSVKLTPSDPQWVGAWWIGVLITSSALALASIPLFFFSQPKRPAINVGSSDDPENQSMINFLKCFPSILLNVLCCPSFMILILANCCVYLSAYGYSSFIMKFMEVQYHSTASYVNLLTGISYPISSIGHLAGGMFISSSKTPFRKLPWVCSGALLLSVVFHVPHFFMGCSSQSPPGVYSNNTMISVSTCREHCSCLDSVYVPVCGEDGREYISPCHAGCTNVTVNSENKAQVYTQCRCVPTPDRDKMGSVQPGKCPQNSCSGLLHLTVVILTMAVFLLGFVNTVLYAMLMRLIPQESKAFGVGLLLMLLDLLASFPSPLLFGFLFDSSCAIWRRTCQGHLTCSMYDYRILRYEFFGTHMGCLTLGSILLLGAPRLIQNSHFELTKEEEESQQ